MGCVGSLKAQPGPIQVIWGDRDPALRIAKHGEAARRAAGVPEIHPDEKATAIADDIAQFVVS